MSDKKSHCLDHLLSETNKQILACTWLEGKNGAVVSAWCNSYYVCEEKSVKTKLTESEIKLYLFGDQTYKSGGTLKGYQVNSVRTGELSFRNHAGPRNITALASSFLSIQYVRASRSLDLFLQSCVAV